MPNFEDAVSTKYRKVPGADREAEKKANLELRKENRKSRLDLEKSLKTETLKKALEMILEDEKAKRSPGYDEEETIPQSVAGQPLSKVTMTNYGKYKPEYGKKTSAFEDVFGEDDMESATDSMMPKTTQKSNTPKMSMEERARLAQKKGATHYDQKTGKFLDAKGKEVLV